MSLSDKTPSFFSYSPTEMEGLNTLGKVDPRGDPQPRAPGPPPTPVSLVLASEN